MTRRKTPDRSSPRRPPPGERSRCITRSLVDAVRGIVAACEATAVFVSAEAVRERAVDPAADLPARLVLLARTREEVEELSGPSRGGDILQVPDVPLTRMGQVKIAVLLALARGLVRRGDVIVCLSGPTDGGALDTVVVVEVGQEFEMFPSTPDGRFLPADVQPEVLARLVSLASELGAEGREGKPVGAAFVVGDADRVLQLSRQMILNPFRGYPPHQRNVADPELEETIKGLATLDGAFVVRGDGVIEACGVMLQVENRHELELPCGLGARHHAAAAITASTDAVAVTISESTGAVTIFRGGRIVTVLKRPRRTDGARTASPSAE